MRFYCKYIIYISAIFLFSLQANASDITISDIENANVLINKNIKGDSARKACESQVSSKSVDFRDKDYAIRKCMSDGVSVVDKEATYTKVRETCAKKSNQSKFGFTNKRKCRKKIMGVIEENRTVN